MLGDNVSAAMLSGLEMCTGIVACCTITYRPLIERVFGTGGTGKSGSKMSQDHPKGNHAKQGWSEISVQRDIRMVSNPAHTNAKQQKSLCANCGGFDCEESGCVVYSGIASSSREPIWAHS